MYKVEMRVLLPLPRAICAVCPPHWTTYHAVHEIASYECTVELPVLQIEVQMVTNNESGWASRSASPFGASGQHGERLVQRCLCTSTHVVSWQLIHDLQAVVDCDRIEEAVVHFLDHVGWLFNTGPLLSLHCNVDIYNACWKETNLSLITHTWALYP